MKLFELASTTEVQRLEAELDRLMASVGIDVRFSRHFIERLLGRERSVTVAEVVDAFKKLKAKYKQRLLRAKKMNDYEAILKDFDNDLNIVFGIQLGQKMPELVNITIKRKDPEAFVANIQGGEELRVGRTSTIKEYVLGEMTATYNSSLPEEDQAAAETWMNHLKKHGQHIGDQDNRRVFYVKYKTTYVYGIEHEYKGQLSTIATFEDATLKDGTTVLRFHLGYTIPEARKSNQMLRLLWFIKDNQRKSIIDYGVQYRDAVSFLKNIATYFDISWYNIKTGEKQAYDPKQDNVQNTPYRGKRMTDWRILIEGSEAPCFPSYGWEFLPFGNPHILFEKDTSISYIHNFNDWEKIVKRINEVKENLNAVT